MEGISKEPFKDLALVTRLTCIKLTRLVGLGAAMEVADSFLTVGGPAEDLGGVSARPRLIGGFPG